MYKFIHTDKYTDFRIEMTIDEDSEGVTWVDLVSRFQDFLVGCNYIFADKTQFDMAEILENIHSEQVSKKYDRKK